MYRLVTTKVMLAIIKEKGIDNVRVQKWYGGKHPNWYLVAAGTESRNPVSFARIRKGIKHWYDVSEQDEAMHDKYGAMNVSFYKIKERTGVEPDLEERKDHHPDCCCQNNPTTELGKELDVVHASNCCPVHNQNPYPCLAEPVCACRINDSK